MGGLFAKPNVVDVSSISNVINQSIINLTSNTTERTIITQTMMATGGSSMSGNTQTATVESSISSILEASQSSDFNTKLANDVSQSLEKKTVALLGAFDGLLQNNNMDMKTAIESNITNMNISNLAPVCSANRELTQSIIAEAGSSMDDNTQTIKANFVQSCIYTVSSNMNTTSDITNMTNQKAKSTQESPLKFITDIMGNLSTMVIFVIFVIIGGFVLMIGPGNLDVTELAKVGLAASGKSKGMRMGDSGNTRRLERESEKKLNEERKKMADDQKKMADDQKKMADDQKKMADDQKRKDQLKCYDDMNKECKSIIDKQEKKDCFDRQRDICKNMTT